jgi:hypothetical protein
MTVSTPRNSETSKTSLSEYLSLRRLTLFTACRYGAFLGSELGRVKMQATPLLRMAEALEKILEDLQPIQSFFKFIFF